MFTYLQIPSSVVADIGRNEHLFRLHGKLLLLLVVLYRRSNGDCFEGLLQERSLRQHHFGEGERTRTMLSTDADAPTSPGTSLCSACGPPATERSLADRLAQLGPVLCECAAYIEAGATEKACHCLALATSLAAGAGDGPLQRLAVPMADCLARRLLRPVPAIADVLIDPSDYLDRRSISEARRSFFDLCPFHKVAFVVGNRAILEAMDNEKQHVHVIDFSGPAAQPCHWIQLLRDFHRRPEGPPHLRLTVVHDDDDFLARTSELLSEEAEELDVPLQFHGVVSQLEELDFNDLHGVLKLKSGEARAITCTLQLHRLLAAAEDVAVAASATAGAAARHFYQMASSSAPPISGGGGSAARKDRGSCCPDKPLGFAWPPPASTPESQMPWPLASFLSAVRALQPKIVVVTEQDAEHNCASFRRRFDEALRYYAAVYDSLDAAAAALRRPAAERARVERVVLGEEIRSALLREGVHRRERHDRLHRWAARMEMAGFRNAPLSYVAVRQGDDALRACGFRGCRNKQHGGCLLMCWCSWPLYSVSAWRPHRSRAGEALGSSEYLPVPSPMATDPVHINFDGVWT
ncbi:hypothetical protein ACP70R_044385 [Stipagrostis hirtigluma subsp. patula]